MPLSTIAAYGLIVGFLVMERAMRQGPEARSLEAGPFDRHSSRRLGMAMLVGLIAMLLAPSLNSLRVGALDNDSIGWAGVGLMVVGIGLRYWAARVLGRFFTRTLRVADDQRLVEQGPYRMIRHPGYSADLLMWAGAALATVNGIAATVVICTMLAAYRYRIRCEEAMLLATMGPPYRAYMKRTWRLVPFIF
jgi:protein-S-isoprenylcysteine O-methyltransferase Ste14